MGKKESKKKNEVKVEVKKTKGEQKKSDLLNRGTKKKVEKTMTQPG